MSDLIKLYNPANASALTKEQLDGLQNLDSAQIKELARSYPNMTMGRAYLLIIDNRKPVEKQLPSLSTFENLWNLREKNGLRHFVAFGFRGNYKPIPTASRRGNVKPRKTEVVDLSDTDLMNLPGFRTADKEFAGQQVEVTKVKKVVDDATALQKMREATDKIKLDLDDEYVPTTKPVKAEPALQTEKPKGKPGRKPKSQTNK